MLAGTPLTKWSRLASPIIHSDTCNSGLSGRWGDWETVIGVFRKSFIGGKPDKILKGGREMMGGANWGVVLGTGTAGTKARGREADGPWVIRAFLLEISVKESWTAVGKTEGRGSLDQAEEFEGNVASDTELQVLGQGSDLVCLWNWWQGSRVAGIGRVGGRWVRN